MKRAIAFAATAVAWTIGGAALEASELITVPAAFAFYGALGASALITIGLWERR